MSLIKNSILTNMYRIQFETFINYITTLYCVLKYPKLQFFRCDFVISFLKIYNLLNFEMCFYVPSLPPTCRKLYYGQR